MIEAPQRDTLSVCCCSAVRGIERDRGSIDTQTHGTQWVPTEATHSCLDYGRPL